MDMQRTHSEAVAQGNGLCTVNVFMEIFSDGLKKATRATTV